MRSALTATSVSMICLRGPAGLPREAASLRDRTFRRKHLSRGVALSSLREAALSLPRGPRPCRSGGASSAAIGLGPLGGFDHPPPTRRNSCSWLWAMSGLLFSSRASDVWAGVSLIRRCRGWPSAPAPAGPGRASRAGVSMALSEAKGTARGPGADRPVRSRAQEHAGSGAGAPGPASGHPRDRQARQPHAVKEELMSPRMR